MSKLIYAVTALALGALVSGFFVNTSNVPLFASIGLSAVVMLLVLFGWSRRIRRGLDVFDEHEQEMDIAEIDVTDDEVFRPVVEEPVVRAPARVGARAVAEETTILPAVSPRKKPAARKTPAAKKAPARKPAAKKPAAAKSTAKGKAAGRKPAARKPPAKKAAAKPAASRTLQRSTSNRPGRVLVIPGRSRYHRAGCRFAKGDQVREVSEATAQRRGYEPCNVCGS